MYYNSFPDNISTYVELTPESLSIFDLPVSLLHEKIRNIDSWTLEWYVLQELPPGVRVAHKCF